MLVRIRDPEVPASLSVLPAVAYRPRKYRDVSAEDRQEPLEIQTCCLEKFICPGRVKLGPDGTEWDTVSLKM
jgi:hypothetical protein